MTTNLDLQLQALMTLAEEGTLPATAERLHLPLTATIRLVDDLEERVGTPLAVRAGGSYWLTPAGLDVVAKAASITCTINDLDATGHPGSPAECHAEGRLPCAGSKHCDGLPTPAGLTILPIPNPRTRTTHPTRTRPHATSSTRY